MLHAIGLICLILCLPYIFMMLLCALGFVISGFEEFFDKDEITRNVMGMLSLPILLVIGAVGAFFLLVVMVGIYEGGPLGWGASLVGSLLLVATTYGGLRLLVR